jgi:biopolymer transport protein ExbD
LAGQAQRGDDDPITDINVTPLVDVSLVLVIIFMAIAPFGMQAGIKVLQSKANVSVGKTKASENVSVRLREDGSMTVNGKKTANMNLLKTIRGYLGASKDKMVMLNADEGNFVGDVVFILDTAKQAGAKKLAIMSSRSGSKG